MHVPNTSGTAASGVNLGAEGVSQFLGRYIDLAWKSNILLI
jgi:hypothetical protein